MPLRDRVTPELVTQTINTLKREIPNFHMDGSSWTNNLGWVQGYENVLTPMTQLNAQFHQAIDPETRESIAI